MLSVANSLFLPHIMYIHVIRRPFLTPIFAFSAPLRESIPLPHLCLLGTSARVNSSSPSLRSLRLCESPLLIPSLRSLRLCESPLLIPSLRPLRLCESLFLTPIFAFSAPLRESTPHPYLCALGVFARVNSSPHSCALCASCGQLLSPLPITPPRALVVLRFLLNNPQEAVCFWTDFTSL